jgi:hypothetical protein
MVGTMSATLAVGALSLWPELRASLPCAGASTMWCAVPGRSGVAREGALWRPGWAQITRPHSDAHPCGPRVRHKARVDVPPTSTDVPNQSMLNQ